MNNYILPIKVFDFFSGCGGSSKGFEQAGLDLVFALDNDPDSKDTFKENMPGVHFELSDIEDFSVSQLTPFIESSKGHPILFCGCAPCQPFTKQNTQPKNAIQKRTLLGEFQKFVECYTPELVFVENVPGMQKVQGKNGPFLSFVQTLDELDYEFKFGVLASQDYGVPQVRRRLVLIASQLGKIAFPEKTHGPGTPNPNYSTVRKKIEHLPPIEAGETYPDDPIHRASNLSDTNLRRIKSLSEGQDRRNWPDELKLPCHSNGYNGHTDVYGRMWWDEPASCLTTRCISLSNGRFGHPEQNRAISVREAALLQTFPEDYVFKGGIVSMARQIGNAVPVLLAKQFGENFKTHVENYIKENE